MSKLVWDVAGQHFFENGVDHGVLFVKKADGSGFEKGVPWNGLTNVSLSPEGAESNDIYADNIKYLSLLSVETLKATIEAYQSPEEFDVCDGTASLIPGEGETKVGAVAGITIGQQERRQFAFSFRTKIGSDAKAEAGYKIHIVYGCMASPSERSYETINDNPDAMALSWDVSTTPVDVEGFKPTALITIDSTKVPAAKLTLIENKLYGTDGASATESTYMSPQDIIDLLINEEVAG